MHLDNMQELRSQLEAVTHSHAALERRLEDLIQSKAATEQQVLDGQQEQQHLQDQLGQQQSIVADWEAANRHLQSQLEEALAGRASLAEDAARLQQVTGSTDACKKLALQALTRLSSSSVHPPSLCPSMHGLTAHASSSTLERHVATCPQTAVHVLLPGWKPAAVADKVALAAGQGKGRGRPGEGGAPAGGPEGRACCPAGQAAAG